jgi:hypothetical protein
MLQSITADELALTGGVSLLEVATGVGMLGAGILAVAALPEVLVGAAAVGAIAGAVTVGASSGYLIGNGLTN